MTQKEQGLYDIFHFGVGHVDYLINVSKTYKYIYFETPKVGCSTIKKTLQKLEVSDASDIPEDVHQKKLSPLLSPLDLEKNFSEYLTDAYFKFSFVRNPYTRILSCYLDKIIGIQKDVYLPKIGYSLTDNVSFKAFLLAIKEQTFFEMDVHWMPQHILLGADKIPLDFIGRQENFDNDLAKVLSIITKSDSNAPNISNERPHAVGANKKLLQYLTKDTAQLIHEIYADDFRLYGYHIEPFNTDPLPPITLNNKHEDPLVSIVIPCYNQAQYLEEAVQSAISQTYTNIEIIIVNDGSTDESEQIALTLQAQYPQIRLLTQENQGLSQARNAAIAAANGTYILPLDADDKLHQKMITQCISVMIKCNMDIIYTDLQQFGEKHDIRHRAAFRNNHLLYENLPPQASLYKKDVWETCDGYKENMNEGYEDWEFWINAYKHGFKFQHHPEVLFYYRIKKESMYTDAYKKHTYLKAKIIMNHPELYPTSMVHNAISTIKETDKTADLYFYTSNVVPIEEKDLLSLLNTYLSVNPLQEIQTISLPGSDKNIGLCSLEIFEDPEQAVKLHKKMNVEFIVFYAPMRFETSLLNSTGFAWNKANGLIEPRGSIFPFVSKQTQKNPQLQLTAYQRLHQYQLLRIGNQNKQIKILDKKISLEVNKKKLSDFNIKPLKKKTSLLQNSYQEVIAQKSVITYTKCDTSSCHKASNSKI